MISNLRFICLLTLALAMVGCQQDDSDESDAYTEPKYTYPAYYQSSVDPSIIDQEIVRMDKSLDVIIPMQEVYKWTDHYSVYTPLLNGYKAVDLHLEVLPIYVFGSGSGSGDYYAVQGYVVSHNGSLFSNDTTIHTSYDSNKVKMMGWYMNNLEISLELLDNSSKAVSSDKVQFFVTPEPSTTIGSTTYTKGFSFTLTPMLTFGTLRRDPEGIDPGGWRGTLLGMLSFGFNWNNSSTQNLPDQTVEMSTNPYNRTVDYKFKTNNVKQSMSPFDIPILFRTDQRVDFSHVWYVCKGCYCATDNNMDHMNLRVTVHPHYRSHISGFISDRKITPKEKGGGYDTTTYIEKIEKYDVLSANTASKVEIPLPAINRIPTATVSIKNCTTSYMSKVRIYRSGEYSDTRTPYSSPKGVCGQNEALKTLLRVGTYDIYYELHNGDTGACLGLFAIKGATLQEGATAVYTTFDGKRVK